MALFSITNGISMDFSREINGRSSPHGLPLTPYKIKPREMLIILTHLGPTVLVWSSFTFLAFLSTGCLAFRLVDRHLSTVQSTSGFFEVVLFVCHQPGRPLLSNQPHSLKERLFLTGHEFVLRDLFCVHSNSNRCAALCSILL